METLQQRQSAVAFPEDLAGEIDLVHNSWLEHAAQWGYDPESWPPLPTPPAEFSRDSSAATSHKSAGVQSAAVEDAPRDLVLRSALQAQLADLKAQRRVLVTRQGEAFDRLKQLSIEAELIRVELAEEKA
jgi:hypothetical protein